MSQVAKESQTKAGSKDSALPVEVSSADLDKTVADAKSAGVKVVQDETKTKEPPQLLQRMLKKQDEIKSDYAKQAEEIKTTTEAYKKKSQLIRLKQIKSMLKTKQRMTSIKKI